MLNFKGMVRRNRVVIVKGTENCRDLYDMIGTIRMIKESEKISYLPVGEGTSMHMIGYKATDDEQDTIKILLEKYYPEVKFTYLCK